MHAHTSNSSGDSAVVVADLEALTHLMQALDQTQQEELTCAETFALLDEYTELIIEHADTEALMPLVKHHLKNCPECHDRYETLLQILQTTE